MRLREGALSPLETSRPPLQLMKCSGNAKESDKEATKRFVRLTNTQSLCRLSLFRGIHIQLTTPERAQIRDKLINTNPSRLSQDG